jgi:hypothetical protein
MVWYIWYKVHAWFCWHIRFDRPAPACYPPIEKNVFRQFNWPGTGRRNEGSEIWIYSLHYIIIFGISLEYSILSRALRRNSERGCGFAEGRDGRRPWVVDPIARASSKQRAVLCFWLLWSILGASILSYASTAVFVSFGGSLVLSYRFFATIRSIKYIKLII